MPVLPALAVLLASVVVALSPTATSATDPALTAGVLAPDVDVDDAVVGVALPIRPRVPNGALLVGADEDYALYHSDHVDPTTNQVDYTLISLEDGRVVRTLRGPRTPCCADVDVHYVDGSIVMQDPSGAIVRHDALTGRLTGTISASGAHGYLALDDEWVLTPTAVRWFDGRVVPVAERLAPSRFARKLGDSDLAILAGARGSDPVVLTPSTGAVTALSRPGDTVRVFAARAGTDPEVFGYLESSDDGEDGLVRWTDPAHAAGRTVVESDVLPDAGGLAGDRLLASVLVDGGARASHLVEIDRTTGAVSSPVADDVLVGLGPPPRVPGDSVVQAGDHVLVSHGTTAGALSLVTATVTRPLGIPRPAPLAAFDIYQASGYVEADFRDGSTFSGSGAITVGDAAWADVPGPIVPPVPAVELGLRHLASCGDGGPAQVMLSRGRWQLERCPGGRERFVTDRLERLAPLAVNATAQLGWDHVVQQITEGTGDDLRAALLVTGLDVRHRTRTYGPLGYDFAVDAVDEHDPVYVDPSGRVRIAKASGLADTTAPSISVTRRPSSYVSSVRPTRLTYTATARDAVDGSTVAVQVQTRRAIEGRTALSGWRTTVASGALSVTAQPGEQWCFRTAAVDRSGNVARSSQSCSLVPVDDHAGGRYGSARRVTGDYLGGVATLLDGPGAAISSRTLPEAQSVVWLRTGPTGGLAVVTAGGEVVQTIDTYARTAGVRVVVLAPVGRWVLVYAATTRPVLVDAIGQRRPT